MNPHGWLILWMELLTLYMAIWGSYDEQHALPVSLLGPCVHQGVDMGLLVKSVSYSGGLHPRGGICQFSHHLLSLDFYTGYPVLSFLPGIGVATQMKMKILMWHLGGLYWPRQITAIGKKSEVSKLQIHMMEGTRAELK